MPERRKRLTEKLNEIDAHLDASEPVGDEMKVPLQQAIGGVRQHLEAPEDEGGDHAVLTESLKDIALELEVSHPKLTALLNHVSELLAGAGI